MLLSKNLVACEQLCLGMQHTSLEADFQLSTSQHSSYLIILLLKHMFLTCFVFSPKVMATYAAHMNVQKLACWRFSNKCACMSHLRQCIQAMFVLASHQ